ncbi:HpaII family restriction endonuclease [Algoriphagus aquimarinus]|uniref:HpaII restriction endonuclease n=1 Tax=Algoriphagus aquimarinus TaxID=237018 RepID=A0A1I1AQ54_9BACT|nr:HpaII family restriction endonuclease [Algoriphagus aquimarinus]SFB40067.1 HpaII restriction endonuclease [Algoriphagus aquimarinus]
MLKGNKGEWSELYVLVTLLAEGKLFQSDVELDKDFSNVYEIIKAYKSESQFKLEFDRQEKVRVYKKNDQLNEQIGEFSFSDFSEISKLLYNGILKGKGSSFAILEAEDFLKTSQINKLKADSTVKSDIQLKIYDHRLAKETDLGFSIKSLLGGDSTLFNTGVGNNFIFSTEHDLEETIEDFNTRTYKPEGRMSKLTFRLQELERLGCEMKFEKIQSNQLWKNLKMIDGDLPEIIGWSLYYRWVFRESSLTKILAILEEIDPMNFYGGEASEQKLYEYKLKRFLTEAAMGMTSEKPWLGEYDSFGGVIIAKKDGDIVCFHIYDFNLFRNYLLNNTKFEQPSTGEDAELPGRPRASGKNYNYGWVYREDDLLKIKINLQIRFR